jgi:hypothetical protein
LADKTDISQHPVAQLIGRASGEDARELAARQTAFDPTKSGVQRVAGKAEVVASPDRLQRIWRVVERTRTQQLPHEPVAALAAQPCGFGGKLGALVGRVDLLCLDRHVEHHGVLPECRYAAHQDVGQQHDEEDRRDEKRNDAIGLEARLGAVAAAHAGLGVSRCEIEPAAGPGPLRPFGGDGREGDGVSHIALDTP